MCCGICVLFLISDIFVYLEVEKDEKKREFKMVGMREKKKEMGLWDENGVRERR